MLCLKMTKGYIKILFDAFISIFFGWGGLSLGVFMLVAMYKAEFSTFEQVAGHIMGVGGILWGIWILYRFGYKELTVMEFLILNVIVFSFAAVIIYVGTANTTLPQ